MRLVRWLQREGRKMSHVPRRGSITRWIIVTVLIVTALLVSCSRYPKLEAYEPGSGSAPPNLEAPVILVGQILSNQAVGRPHAPQWDRYIKMRQYRLMVRAEHVFRGNIPQREVPVYYFGYITNMGGSPRIGMRQNGGDWHVGDSVVFFLRRERGVLRTVCDFYEYCSARVFTGIHPNLKIDPNKPLGCSIAELLLSRGPETTDIQMVRAILRGKANVYSDSCRNQRLKELEKDPSPTVREAAICVERATPDRPCRMRYPPEA